MTLTFSQVSQQTRTASFSGQSFCSSMRSPLSRYLSCSIPPSRGTTPHSLASTPAHGSSNPSSSSSASSACSQQSSLSRDYVEGSPDAASYRISGDALIAVYDWGVLFGIMLFFALAGLLLNYVLYRYRLVPRWLALWGLIGIGLLLIEGALEAFDVENLEIMSLPFAVQEMVFAVWAHSEGTQPVRRLRRCIPRRG